MQPRNEIGNIEGKIYEEWKITDFFSFGDFKGYESPCFSFMGTSWVIDLYPKSSSTPGFMCLYLRKLDYNKYSAYYNIGLKRVDNSVKLLQSGVLRANELWTKSIYFELSELEEQKSELMPSGMLIITCTLTGDDNLSDQPRMMDESKFRKLIKLGTLSENFKWLLSNKESCDTTLHVKNKEYKAHKAVLMARSTVFASMFLHDTSEKQTGIVTISDCDSKSFEEFLEFLYCGKLELTSPNSAIHLYDTSEKYDVEELKIFCTEYLAENLTVEIFSDVVVIADKYEDSKLLSAAQDFFNKNLNKIFLSSEWDCLVRNNYRLSKDLLTKMSLKVKVVD